MITIQGRGRLGNRLFQHCAASILAKKFNIKVEKYMRLNELSSLGTNFYNEGINTYSERIQVRNKNFLEILETKEIHYGLNLTDYYQLKEFVLNYKEEILSNFNLKYDEQYKDDLFIHARLGDYLNLGQSMSIDYYIESMKNIEFKNGYISTDSPDHEIVQTLIKKYNLTLYNGSPAETINFAKNFKTLLLSGGTFGFWMAFLSRATNVFYPEKSSGARYGDIYCFDNWTPITAYKII